MLLKFIKVCYETINLTLPNVDISQAIEEKFSNSFQNSVKLWSTAIIHGSPTNIEINMILFRIDYLLYLL